MVRQIPFINVVLVQPEIPNNTGCVGRTVIGIDGRLHLVEPLGFDLSDKNLKRAGLDYWPKLDLQVHSGLVSFQRVVENSLDDVKKKVVCFSAKSERSLYDVSFERGDWMVFGSESVGLPTEILNNPDYVQCKIPTNREIRSLNLATAVGVAVFEAKRQIEQLSRATP